MHPPAFQLVERRTGIGRNQIAKEADGLESSLGAAFADWAKIADAWRLRLGCGQAADRIGPPLLIWKTDLPVISRRTTLFGLMALLATPAFADDFQPVPDAGYDAWVVQFRARALKRGISGRVLDAAFRHAGFLPGVIARDRSQAESIYGLEDYLAITASDERIVMGRQVLKTRAGLLAKIEARYGVEARVVAAIWGVESFYGTKRGNILVISALSTLAYEGRRADFFEGQLMAALAILQHGDVAPDQMTGGWAGAMGHTQFIPSTYQAFAVDFTGDGRRDVWGDDPSDALASAAHYLSVSGWVHGQPWGVEVRVPNGAKGLGGKTKTIATWRKAGLVLANGGQVPDHGPARLVTSSGPGFLLFHNGLVLGRYNASSLYIVGVGILSDRIAGGGPIIGGFPPDANGLTQADRILVQQRLTRLGYDTGSADGVFGAKTTSAIAGFQKAKGVAVTGVATQDLVALLR